MALKRLLHIQIYPDTTIPSYYGSLDTRMLGVKGKKKRKKRFEAENDIHICAFQKYRTAQTDSLKNAALFIATFVNISPLNILTVFSLKSNSSKH